MPQPYWLSHYHICATLTLTMGHVLFVMRSWLHPLQVYTIYSILSLVFVILIIVTAFITIALTYFQLAVEDHGWWWRSFLCGGSTGAQYPTAFPTLTPQSFTSSKDPWLMAAVRVVQWVDWQETLPPYPSENPVFRRQPVILVAAGGISRVSLASPFVSSGRAVNGMSVRFRHVSRRSLHRLITDLPWRAGIFIYFYCFYYYLARSDMSGFMQTSFFFGAHACENATAEQIAVRVQCRCTICLPLSVISSASSGARC